MVTTDPSLRSATRRRIILFPTPFQGHINPMLQLANILHTHGFQITIIHAKFNAPNPSNHPHFSFKPINDGFAEIADQLATNQDATYFRKYLNKSCEDPFRDCLAGLLAEPGQDPVACLITDAAFYFAQAVADELKLPRMVLRTSNLGCVLAYDWKNRSGSEWNLGSSQYSRSSSEMQWLPRHCEPFFEVSSASPSYRWKINKRCRRWLKTQICRRIGSTFPDSDYEASVPEFPLVKFKDIAKITTNPQGMGEFVTNMFTQMRASSGIIWNTFKELEESDLETISKDFPVPSFTLGPFHEYFPATSSSLIEQDRTILSWLDKQAPKSVVYVSFGSGARITESEFQEVAHGLSNIDFPFVWVVRPGAVAGSEWLESLPENFVEGMGERGRIVKWSPQHEVLAHPATGCFWTHNGWNSTLESICEGVPMICSPCYADQPINARNVSDVWKIGVFLEDGFERAGIEMAIKRVMMDEEGEEIRERISCLKEKVKLSLDEGGSSFQSLKSLVDYISSL
ncbi:hypothetical protein E3N88_03331 [Mikania micrantha]|uniref:Glycosyltransferase n=1 Tax=Mikania micrantha TaxID=192012 RepID=A0A5N6Q695_9ASTR|nr:hypothetical protein E3N88_03331 [Mikania micrantha]